MKERFNGNYKIIMSIKLPDYEFVLGENLDACCSQYVTWFCKKKKEYHYGHYFNNKQKAELNLYQRAYNDIKYRYDKLKEIIENESK